MAREYKHYELKKARKPRNLGSLATTMTVTLEDGRRGIGYIRFSETFVKAVGRKLPRGVAAHDPAYLDVSYSQEAAAWEITAHYLTGEAGVLLWKTANKPTWLNCRGEQANDDDSQADTRPGKSGGPGSGTRSRARSKTPRPDAPQGHSNPESG